MAKQSDHYVPEFYLNEFASNSSHRRALSVWFYDLENPRPTQVATTRIAKIKNFYLLVQDASVNTGLDDALKHFESEVAPVFRKLRVEEMSFGETKKRYIFGRFVCFLAFRTPQFRNHLNILFQNKMKTKLMDHYNKMGGTKALETDLKNQLDQDITVEEFIESFNKIRIQPKSNALQFFLVESAKRMIPAFCGMKWHFLRSDSDESFITSDAPVVMHNPENRDPSIRYGYLQKSIQIIFPVNRSLCLVATWN
ncbi:MAG: DUF4238 domain-containing protein, partial [Ignavibacteriae bacterium]|nr:DUF4238 domain-containing protein [Ignavibacteriota bacterium]